MPRRTTTLLLLGCVLMLACARAHPAPHYAAAADTAVAVPYPVVDLMPSFWAFWDQDRPVAGADTAALVARFRERVVRPESAFYARAARGPSDAQIRAFLGRVGADVPAMRAVGDRLGRDLARHSRTFAESLPDFEFNGLVFFYPSLYVRDGGTMSYPPGVALMFGIDAIARIHGPDAELGVLFHHELFHLYHAQHQPARDTTPPPLFRRVWGEGLATYASRRLNPAASELALLLNDRALLAARRRVPALAARLLEQLDDTSSAMARLYLLGGTRDADVPPRAGYLLGLWAAELMGRRRTLQELARLDDATVRREMAVALRALADGVVPRRSRGESSPPTDPTAGPPRRGGARPPA